MKRHWATIQLAGHHGVVYDADHPVAIGWLAAWRRGGGNVDAGDPHAGDPMKALPVLDFVEDDDLPPGYYPEQIDWTGFPVQE